MLVDNDPGSLAGILMGYMTGVTLDFSRPSKPTGN